MFPPKRIKRSRRRLLDTHYRVTVHVDRSLVLRTDKDTGECGEYPLSGAPETWAREVMDAVSSFR